MRTGPPRIYRSGDESPAALVPAPRWSINGWPATVWIWTAEEWARLVDPPTDAQRLPNGIWCALRMES